MNRALIVIDVQESFCQQPSWAAISSPGIAGQVRRLVQAARAQGDLVVWVLHTEPGTGTPFDPASGHVRLMDGLEPLDGEPVITKTSHNAFTTTNLQQVLTIRGISRSAPPGRSIEEILADPLTLPAREVISRTEYALAGRFAVISSVTEVSGSSSPGPAGVRA
jgi:hypothetical protein